MPAAASRAGERACFAPASDRVRGQASRPRAQLDAPVLWAGRRQDPHKSASPPAARFACLLAPAVVVGLAC